MVADDNWAVNDVADAIAHVIAAILSWCRWVGFSQLLVGCYIGVVNDNVVSVMIPRVLLLLFE